MRVAMAGRVAAMSCRMVTARSIPSSRAVLTLGSVCSLHEEELKPVLNLPDNISTYALLPVGYPMGKFGPVRRMAVEEITCVDQWDTPFKRPA